MPTTDHVVIKNTRYEIQDTYARSTVADVPNKADKDLSNVTGILPIANGGTNASTAAAARTNLGLGSVATESTVPIAKGGTGATTAAAARSNLGAEEITTYATFTGTSLTAVNRCEYSSNETIRLLGITWPAAARGVIFGVNFNAGGPFTGITHYTSTGSTFTPKYAGDSPTTSSKRMNLICWYDGVNYWCAVKAA